MWTHLRDETVKSRKVYRCRVCNEQILVGEIHVARTGIWEGRPVTQRMHSECEKLSAEWDQDDWETLEPGEVDRPKK